MPPTNELKRKIDDYITTNKVMIFSKEHCPYCTKVKELFNTIGYNDYTVLELDQLENGSAIQDILLEMTGIRTVPNVFINGKHIGDSAETERLHKENLLAPLLNPPTQYDYDLIVIGGGSGGLAAAKEAADLGKKVVCLDFVKPSPQGTTWGLGGTCVNVGCIPKKLMHQAAILGHSLDDAKKFGWEVNEKKTHNWETMKDAIQDHIGSLNWGYRVQLRDKNVKYLNSFAEFVGPHKIKAVNRRGKEEELTAEHYILAMGGRPRYPDIPGMKEYAISSDDLFSLPYCPGKTLVIGASYVALECAGFLVALGLDCTVMVRSILLRGFDQQMAEAVGDYMATHGCKFVRPCVPTKVEKLQDGSPGLYRVTGRKNDGTEEVAEYNTILVAVGRDPCTSNIGLENLGVKVNPKTGYIPVNDVEQTNLPYVYAIGDIQEGRPELTPVAIQAGRLLSRRLFAGSQVKMDYVNVATTVFTPLEYGSIGMSEEDAIAKYTENDIEVFHSKYWPLEWTVAGRENNVCYAKLICHISQNMKVLGLHICGPNAGEVTQGFALGMKLGATKQDFDNTVGIHPTVAEVLTTLDVTKRSGTEVLAAGC